MCGGGGLLTPLREFGSRGEGSIGGSTAACEDSLASSRLLSASAARRRARLPRATAWICVAAA